MIKVCSEISFSQIFYHMEISQLNCKTLQLTGFNMIQVFSEGCFRIGSKTAFVFSPPQRAQDPT